MQRNKRHTKTRPLVIDRLEDRSMMAGDVAADFDGFVLAITGDRADNEIAVYEDAEGTVWVEGRAGTTINGGAAPVPFVPTAPLLFFAEIEMGDGDDAVDVGPVGPNWGGGLSVQTGAGLDEVSVRDAVFGGRLLIHTQQGRDQVLVEDVIASAMTLSTGAGHDEAVVRNLDANFTSNTTWIHTGAGNDDLLLDRILVYELDVRTGKGNDMLELRGNSEVTGGFAVFVLGDGNDVLEGDDSEDSSFKARLIINGGKGGHDTVRNLDYFLAPVIFDVTGFEVIED